MGGEYEDDCEGHCGMDVTGNLIPMVDIVPSTSTAVLPSSYFPPRNKFAKVNRDQMEEIHLR